MHRDEERDHPGPVSARLHVALRTGRRQMTLLLLALCLMLWILASIVPLPPPWRTVIGAVLIAVILLALLGLIHPAGRA